MAVAETGLGQIVWPFSVDTAPGERFTAIPFRFSLAAGQTLSSTYQISASWDLVTSILNSHSTGAYRLQITDGDTQENLFLGEIRGALITGIGREPFIMPKTHRFKGGTNLTITVTDISGASNVVEVVLIGHKSLVGRVIETMAPTAATREHKFTAPALERVSYVIDRLFIIPFNFRIIGPAGSVYTDKYPISRGFDFMWEAINSNIPDENITLQIKDEFVTEEFFTSPVRAFLITGIGQRPGVLPRPYIFVGGTHITLTVVDVPGRTVALVTQIIFIGYRVRRIG